MLLPDDFSTRAKIASEDAVEGVLRERVTSARELRDRLAGEQGLDPRLDFLLGDVVGALEALVELVAPVREPEVSIVLDGERVPIERPAEVDPRVDAFERICILLGAASHASADDLLPEVGNICASVRGVTDPMSAASGKRYAHKVDRLTKRQRQIVRGETP